ncbi:MAG: FeoB-associated Cys-rich membrane protein [Candidatus Reddybacter sp.]
MNSQQQEWLALAVVFLVAGIAIFRWLKKRRQGGSGCGSCEQSSCTSGDKTRP